MSVNYSFENLDELVIQVLELILLLFLGANMYSKCIVLRKMQLVHIKYIDICFIHLAQ